MSPVQLPNTWDVDLQIVHIKQLKVKSERSHAAVAHLANFGLSTLTVAAFPRFVEHEGDL